MSSRYDRHFVDITWHDVWSSKAKICGVIHIKLNQLVYENVHAITSLPLKRIKRYYTANIFSEYYLQDGGENQLA